MQCYVCDKNDWHVLEGIHPRSTIQVCKPCGNVAHAKEPADEQKMIDYYRKEYRPMPRVSNLITTTHKLNYIRLFLQDFLKDKKALICGDVGCATGYIPNFLRGLGHKAFGCELTVTYRRFAEHFYGIPVSEELDTRLKYDLITIYHVLEHLIEPDKKLKKYVDLLAEDGRMMIATPQFLDTIEEASGTPIGSFDHLFHEDHINVFTECSIKNLFAKAGLVVEKENHITYGQTYLLRKAKPADNLMAAPIVEQWQNIANKIMLTKQAIELFKQNKFTEATEIAPRFPEAWIQNIYVANMKNPERQAELFEQAFKVLPDNARLHLASAQWHYMSQRYEEALKEFEWFNVYKPNEDVYMFMGWCYRLGKKDPTIACRFFEQSFQMNPQKWVEGMDNICTTVSERPNWEEVAMAKLSEAMSDQARPHMRPKDPAMEGLLQPGPAAPGDNGTAPKDAPAVKLEVVAPDPAA